MISYVVRLGTAGLGLARHGVARLGKGSNHAAVLGMAGPGPAWRGWARRGQ